jgi:uncharacterized protein YyaL (SSP411 family)
LTFLKKYDIIILEHYNLELRLPFGQYKENKSKEDVMHDMHELIKKNDKMVRKLIRKYRTTRERRWLSFAQKLATEIQQDNGSLSRKTKMILNNLERRKIL